MRRALVACLLCSLVLSPAVADEGAAKLELAVKKWVTATDDAARMEAALGVLMQKPSAAGLAAALEKGLAPPKNAPTSQLVMWTDKTAAGKQHTIYAQAPSSYDATKPMPLFVWLHGGVSRGPDGGGQSGVQVLGALAEEEGFLVLSPSGREGAVWWDPAGNQIIRNAIREMGRRYNVDRDRIAIGGFSDGATGVYHLLVSDPMPYACFFALAGHPMVARMFGSPTHVCNLKSRPVYATHGGKDQLYPTARMKPFVDELIEKGARLDWKDLPEAEHRFEAVVPLLGEILTYWSEHPRAVAPKEAAWQTSEPEHYGRYEWIEIDAIDTDAPKTDAFKTDVLPLPPIPAPRPRLGIRIDTEFEGDGLSIQDVETGTPAHEAGLKTGDVIVEVDGATLDGETREALGKLRVALQKMTSEERDGVFVVQRGEERLEMKTRPRALESDVRKPGSGHGKPAGKIVAVRVAQNRFEVGTVNVKRFKLHLGDEVSFDEPVVVVVNGKERFNGMVKPDPAYVLTEAYRLGHAPRTHAAITLTP